MPLYQTKTIANILEPVAQQVLNQKPNISFKGGKIKLNKKSTHFPGQQIDHPSRGGRGWKLNAQPGGPRGGCEQGREQPCQVRGAGDHLIFYFFLATVKCKNYTVMSCQDVVRRHIHDILV